MVGLGRFELPTSPLSGVRSNQLSYRPKGLGSLKREDLNKTLKRIKIFFHSFLTLFHMKCSRLGGSVDPLAGILREVLSYQTMRVGTCVFSSIV